MVGVELKEQSLPSTLSFLPHQYSLRRLQKMCPSLPSGRSPPEATGDKWLLARYTVPLHSAPTLFASPPGTCQQ